jgi:hypothetical protein
MNNKSKNKQQKGGALQQMYKNKNGAKEVGKEPLSSMIA